MAKSSNNMVMFFNLVLVLSLLLIMSIAEARLFGRKCVISIMVYIKSFDWSFKYFIIVWSSCITLNGHGAFLWSRNTTGFGKRDATPECDTVIGVSSGDTCFGVSQFFNLTVAEFLAINPNLNCSSLFVGQWLCVEGIANWAYQLLISSKSDEENTNINKERF